MANVQLSAQGTIIKTAYEGQSDTNAFTDTEKTKLTGISAGATVNDTDANLKNRSNHTGTQAISTVTGLQTALDSKATGENFTSTLKTKLDGIETGATADQTGAQIVTLLNAEIGNSDWQTSGGGGGGSMSNAEVKTAYEANSNTNAFTDAEQTKLAGIATGATVNDTDTNLKNRVNHTGTQAISTVTGLQTALDGKAASSHTHSIANVTGLQTALDDKLESSDIANVVESDVTGITGAAAITNIVSVTQAEYDALTANATTLYIIED